jgi:hypothetical protein
LLSHQEVAQIGKVGENFHSELVSFSQAILSSNFDDDEKRMA